MKIPSFMHVQYVQPSNGYLTSDMQHYHDELNQNLEINLGDNGWQVPQLTNSEINNIASSKPDGTLWYDKDNNKLTVKENGSIKTVNTT